MQFFGRRFKYIFYQFFVILKFDNDSDASDEDEDDDLASIANNNDKKTTLGKRAGLIKNIFLQFFTHLHTVEVNFLSNLAGKACCKKKILNMTVPSFRTLFINK